MYIIKKVATTVFCVFLICLLLAPVGILYFISQNEQAQYQPEPVPVVEELAYGDVLPVVRRDIYETIKINGTVVSASDFFVELKARDPYDLRFMVSVGDVIHPGDLIAYDGSKKIVSDAYGLISEISLGNDPYLRLCSLEDLALECYVNDTQRAILQRSSLELLDEDGTSLTLLDMDEIYTNGNSIRVLLRYDAENLRYGQTFSDLILSTGKVYSQALVVDERCVYRKPNTDSYYLRLVDQDGHFISETQVKVGYSDGTYICVSGIEEGTLCDSGYKTLAEEQYAGT